ncbi:uncharacterized protein LOC129570700 [Sitodiplosis mosellana]|uniref:uncharacterized protein LOC129570700 n=1 Tax=Sitodiplosis mosellana TaxID=263140 RepID=UPI00244442D7|nr:uncharacterized protein LOC129570700 [Sitodiplosis mosellana]XP_055306378.1 uncharacterized protein LOC129570700 [Sitodiplosis mosellana]
MNAMSLSTNRFRKRNHNGELMEVEQPEKLRSVESNAPIKLTELNEECLMHIMGLLNLDALSVVAQVNMRLNQLVYNFLEEKYDVSKVSLFTSDQAQWLWLGGTTGKFIFKDLSDVTKFFRKTGDLITCLSISCSPHSSLYHMYQMVEKSIFEHCYETLTKIEIASNLLPVLSEVTKVFYNVEELYLHGCELSENLSQQFDIYFPSLVRLTLIDCKTRDPKCIETQFACLEELTVVGKRKNRMVFKKTNIKEAIRRNPQLRRLVVDFNSTNDREAASNDSDYELDSDFYRFVSEALPKLKSLKVFGERKHQVDPTEDDIEFWRLKKLSLHYIYSQDPSAIAPFKFNRLRELKLQHMTTLSDEWVQFIIRNDCLEKLTVDIKCSWEDENEESHRIHSQIEKEQLLTIVKWLPKLEELHLSAGAVDTKDIMAILPKRKSLMKIYLRDYNEIDSIVDTFDKLTAKKKWLVDYDAQNLILKRFA